MIVIENTETKIVEVIHEGPQGPQGPAGGGGGSIGDGDKGDILVSNTGTVWTVDAKAISYAKIQDVSATNKILGRASAGSGTVEEITCTAAGRALLDDADAAAQRVTLGAGDVNGPASSVDNAIARFDATTGKLIQSSLATLSDTGDIDATSAAVDYLQIDTAAIPPATAAGRVAWNDGTGTAQLGLKGGVTSLDVGEQKFARVYNDTGATLSKGQVVYISGAQGNRISVKLAKADSDSTSAQTIGFVAESIAAGAEGWVITDGTLSGLVTTGLTDGAVVYLSATTAGAYTTVKPSAPVHTVILGFVQRVHASAGSFYVKCDNGYELDELHNVSATSATSGNTLIYDAVAGLWKAANLTDGGGITITEGAGTITVSVSDGDKGDVVVSGSGANWQIENKAVSYAKIQDVSATDRILGRVSAGAGTVEEITCTAAGRALLDDADAAAQRTTLGLGTLATQSGTFSGSSSGNNSGDQMVFKTISVAGQTDIIADSIQDTLTLAAGPNVTITTDATNDIITISATGGGGGGTSYTAGNGLDLVGTEFSVDLKANGGLVIEATELAVDLGASAITGTLAIADGGTGATTAADARTNLGLGTLATQNGTFSGTSSGTNTGDQTITLTGDVTGTGTGSFAATIANLAVTTAKVANDAITYAKLQNVVANRLLGREPGADGDAQELQLGSNLVISGGALQVINLQKTITSGTAAPSGGSDGDIYLQYT